MREAFRKTFRTKIRDEWCKVLRRLRCMLRARAVVLGTRGDPHKCLSQKLVEVAGVEQPAAAPRFSRLRRRERRTARTRRRRLAALSDWGFGRDVLNA